MHERIREKVSSLGGTLGGNLRILYGGSVSAHNCGSFLKEGDIDGGSGWWIMLERVGVRKNC